MSSLSVLGLQIANVSCTSQEMREENLKAASQLIRANPGFVTYPNIQGYDIYLLPELSSVGYADEMLLSLDTASLCEEV